MSDDVAEVEAYFPEKLQCLFEPCRYKILHGGRGGGKSWAIARALLLQGTQDPLRILCAREFQSSINDSVHKLLSDQISELRLDWFYTVEKATIYGANGTEFRFAGIKTNVGAIKSFEGIDRCWVEEASNVSNYSWDVLIPTVRKAKSEIWISFNPELEDDATYKRFVVNPPPNSVVQKITYADNEYFPEVLKQEMQFLKDTDLESYNHIWLGYPRSALQGAVYGKELARAQADGRITSVPYDAQASVEVFFDLGFADATAVWFVQHVGQEYHIIDYLEDSGLWIGDYVKRIREMPYVIGRYWLPHDARARQIGTTRSVEESLRHLGCDVNIVPRLSIEDGINAARAIFIKCWFDDKKTQDGRNALSRYCYDEKTGKPIHNEYSHAADSFRYMALSIGRPKTPIIKLVKKPANIHSAHNWMSR